MWELTSLKTEEENTALKRLGCDSKMFKRVSRETLLLLKGKRIKQKRQRETRQKHALPVQGFAGERK